MAAELAKCKFNCCSAQQCGGSNCNNPYHCGCAADPNTHSHQKDGKLTYKDIPYIRECSMLCPCHATQCPNRVVGNGIQVKLEVFKTKECGWGVRAGQDIPQNTFISEYCGEILSFDEAEERKSDDDYFLETETIGELDRRFDGEDFELAYVIDAKRWGNVARFFNGSCDPNMYKEKVTNRKSRNYPLRVAFYAKKDIHKGDELCWDYQYFKSTKEGSLEHRSLNCHCGAVNCRKVLY